MTIKRQWFDMIASGEKKEEYRGLTDYWFSRVMTSDQNDDKFLHFDQILLINGYNKTSPRLLVECKGITIGAGKRKWGGDPNDECLIFKLGKVISVTI